MNIVSACDQLNRRDCGPLQGCDVVQCEDGRTLMVYANFTRAVLITLLPLAIVRAEPEIKEALIRNATWTVHAT